MRYAGTTISGTLAGMGGFVYALTTSNCMATGDVAGYGFLALAVMIFGNWKPLNIAGASLLFGLFKCIASSYSSINIGGVFIFNELGLSAHFYRMLPYIITLVVLASPAKAPRTQGGRASPTTRARDKRHRRPPRRIPGRFSQKGAHGAGPFGLSAAPGCAA